MPYKNKKQQREYQRLWMKSRRDNFFSGKICILCGSSDNLELDHIDPDKKISHRIWSWSSVRRESELIKCQILCCECHKEKTISQRKKTEHGRGCMYQYHKCRCDICREWKRKSDKFYKDRKSGRANIGV